MITVTDERRLCYGWRLTGLDFIHSRRVVHFLSIEDLIRGRHLIYCLVSALIPCLVGWSRTRVKDEWPLLQMSGFSMADDLYIVYVQHWSPTCLTGLLSFSTVKRTCVTDQWLRYGWEISVMDFIHGRRLMLCLSPALIPHLSDGSIVLQKGRQNS
jgi:hypothetical protein